LLEDSLRYFAVRLSNHKMFLSYLLDGEVSTPYEYLPDNWQVTRAELDDWVKGFGVVYRLHNRRAKPEYLLGQRLFLTLDLIPEEPLLLQAPVAAIPETDTNVGKDRVSDADFVTALVYDPECDQIIEKQYVPGSSLHGVLRSRAEKIVRTLNFYRDVDPARLDDHFQDFERAYYERICACAVTHMVKEKFPDQDGESDEKRMAREQWPEEGERARLLACFGTPQKQQNAQAVMAELTTLGDTRHAEELYEKSCVACRMFGNSMMRGRLLVSDATLLPSRASAKLFDHVAIDRFHGGAADQKKFDSRPLMPRPDANHPSVFAPLFRCTIALERFEPWMLGLLGHLLKDLAEGDIRLGHATRRGYGRVRSVVSAAELYVLPGSELHRLCLYTGLLPKSLQERSLLPPFWQISLNLATLFASETWNENTATSAPEAIFLSACDAALQELVEEEEGQPHGSF
jgi:CRISPR/Cas system CSM-associated protein Csm3 (group 7 of RAMP superfamily)